MPKQSGVMFLADENISPKLVAILRHLNQKCIWSMHAKDFADCIGRPDEEWIPTVARRGYISITCDRRMPLQLKAAQALIEAKARVIFLSDHFQRSRTWNQALWLLRHWHEIRAFAEDMTPGQLVRVSWPGKIEAVKLGQTPRRSPKPKPRSIVVHEASDGQAALDFAPPAEP